MKTSYTAAVVGLGNIGHGYDYDCADDSRVLTHAAAFHHHPGFELIGGVDPDPAARDRFQAKFRKPAFPSIKELCAHAVPEVVALSNPTPLHPAAFQEMTVYAPKAVLCEKPLAIAPADAESMMSAAKRAGTLLAVNYIRRFEPGVLELKRRIKSGELGTFYKGIQWYTKGVLTNGSHFVDLLAFLFGPAAHVTVLDPGRAWGRFDREPDAVLRFGDLTVHFLAAREESFSLRDLQLVSDRVELRYRGGGETIEIRPTRPHPFISGYTVLADEPERIPTDLRRYQWHVADALHKALTSGASIASTGGTALETLNTVWEMMAGAPAEKLHV